MLRRFTLLELVVAMAVIALSTGLAVTAFRGESDVRAMENFMLNLESYFARVRYRATEEGVTWEVYFDDATRTFSACRHMTVSEHEELLYSDGAPPPVLKWRHPEKIAVAGVDVRPETTIETINQRVSLVEQRREEEETAGADYAPAGVRLFYFYADGFVGGTRRLEAQCGEISRIMEVSPLTGRLIELREEAR